MKFCLFVFLALCGVLAQNEESGGKDHVIELDESNFDEELSKHEYLLIEFYAPWCGHCKELEPEYKKAASILSNDHPPLYLAKVDATKNKELAKRFKLDGYPTVTLYTKGADYVEYDGERKAGDIISWYRRKVNPVSTQLDTIKEINSFIDVHKVAVIFLGEQNNSYQEFLKVAKEMDSLHFAHCPTVECVEHYEINKPNEVLLFKNFDDRIVRLLDVLESSKIKQFILDNVKPFVSSFDEPMAEYIFSGNRVAMFYLKSLNNTTHDEVFKLIAKEYKDKMVFVSCDINGDWESRLAAFLGVTEGDLPTIRLLNATEEAPTYIFKDAVTVVNLRNFINSFYEGRLTRFFKSEPIPETQDSPVFKLVGDSFKTEVYESGKNVLVEFYAPWCDHCKKLEPRYLRIAEAYKDIPNLRIAKIDATANDVEGLEFTGFPAIKLFLAGQRKGIDLVDHPGTETITRLLNENLNLNIEVEFDTEESREKNIQDYHYDL
jgi:protein disulfide-isomerase A1